MRSNDSETGVVQVMRSVSPWNTHFLLARLRACGPPHCPTVRTYCGCRPSRGCTCRHGCLSSRWKTRVWLRLSFQLGLKHSPPLQRYGFRTASLLNAVPFGRVWPFPPFTMQSNDSLSRPYARCCVIANAEINGAPRTPRTPRTGVVCSAAGAATACGLPCLGSYIPIGPACDPGWCSNRQHFVRRRLLIIYGRRAPQIRVMLFLAWGCLTQSGGV